MNPRNTEPSTQKQSKPHSPNSFQSGNGWTNSSSMNSQPYGGQYYYQNPDAENTDASQFINPAVGRLGQEASLEPYGGSQWSHTEKESYPKLNYTPFDSPASGNIPKKGLVKAAPFYPTSFERQNETFTTSFLSEESTKEHSEFPSVFETKEEEKLPAKQITEVDIIMSTIVQHQVNSVSLLNEISSKTKKRVDYLMKDVPLGKIKVYECACIFDKDKIGEGKGNSKQGAKSDSAAEGIRLLLTEEKFSAEKLIIIASVQKLTGLNTESLPKVSAVPILKPSQPSQPSQSSQPSQPSQPTTEPATLESSTNPPPTTQNTTEKTTESEAALLNDSALYELNLLADKLSIEANWTINMEANGQFVASVVFDTLEASGEGRRKIDAKRVAALKIIQQIRGDPELNEKYNINPKKPLDEETEAGLRRSEQIKKFFESSFDPVVLADLQGHCPNTKESSTKCEKNFESYLTSVNQKSELEPEALDEIHKLFKQISNYTEMATSNPKQIFMDSPMHLADFVSDCSLIPINPFALNSLKSSSSSFQVAICFSEKKPISAEDFFDLYLNSLNECKKLGGGENDLNFDFRLEREGKEYFLSVSGLKTKRWNKMQIYRVVDSQDQKGGGGGAEQNKYKSTILHVQRICQTLEDPEKLKLFQNASNLMQIWKNNSHVSFLNSELLDAIILTEILNNKNGNLAITIMNCLTILSSEETLRDAIEKCNEDYVKMYEEIPWKWRLQISTQSTQSLEAVYDGNFQKTSFY